MRRRKMHPVGKAIVLVACGILGGAAYYGLRYWDYPLASRDLDGAVEAYRKVGLPWHASDLAPNPPVTDAENAGPLIRTAIRAWPGSDDFDVRPISKVVDSGQYARGFKDLQKYAAMLKLAAEAAERPRVDFGRNWDDGMESVWPEYTKMWEWGTLFGARARARAGLGDVDGAVTDLRTILRLADRAGQEPTWNALNNRLRLGRQAQASVEACAAIFAQKPEALKRLQALLDEPRLHDDLARALEGEAYLRLATLRRSSDFGAMLEVDVEPPQTEQEKPPPSDLPDGMRERAYMAVFLRMWTEAKPAIDRYRDDPEALTRHLSDLRDKFCERKSLSNSCNSILFPFAETDAMTMNSAGFVVQRALLAALQVRAKTGHFPTSISQIPGNWIDPYTGGPLHMAKVNGSYRIYSLGPDLRDQGGRSARETGSSSDDIIAAYPPLPRPPVGPLDFQ